MVFTAGVIILQNGRWKTTYRVAAAAKLLSLTGHYQNSKVRTSQVFPQPIALL